MKLSISGPIKIAASEVLKIKTCPPTIQVVKKLALFVIMAVGG